MLFVSLQPWKSPFAIIKKQSALSHRDHSLSSVSANFVQQFILWDPLYQICPVKRDLCNADHTDLEECTSALKKSREQRQRKMGIVNWLPKKYESINRCVGHWSRLLPCHCQHRSSLPGEPSLVVCIIIIIHRDNGDHILQKSGLDKITAPALDQ